MKGYVKLSFALKNENQFHFIVEDTGVGISEENLKTIFSNFNKVK